LQNRWARANFRYRRETVVLAFFYEARTKG
jgi:hypothetical protein